MMALASARATIADKCGDCRLPLLKHLRLPILVPLGLGKWLGWKRARNLKRGPFLFRKGICYNGNAIKAIVG
jgi:hypothetical protein